MGLQYEGEADQHCPTTFTEVLYPPSAWSTQASELVVARRTFWELCTDTPESQARTRSCPPVFDGVCSRQSMNSVSEAVQSLNDRLDSVNAELAQMKMVLRAAVREVVRLEEIVSFQRMRIARSTFQKTCTVADAKSAVTLYGKAFGNKGLQVLVCYSECTVHCLKVQRLSSLACKALCCPRRQPEILLCHAHRPRHPNETTLAAPLLR